MLNLTGGGLSGGYRKYLQRLVPLLRVHPDISELLVVAPPDYVSLAGGEDIWTWEKGEQLRGYPALRKRVRAWKPDVVFVPTARYIDCGVPCVSMVRNMEPMLPPTFRDGLVLWAKGRMRGVLARRAASNSTRVIAVSRFVRDHLVDHWGIDARRIGIVYHGVDKGVDNGVDNGVDKGVAETNLHPTLRQFDDTRFLFSAGSLLPYRGLEDAIRALARIDSRTLQLVVAGEGLNAYADQMHTLADECGVADRIVWLGHVNQTQMTWAFTKCLAFLMTSRVEACPNTALEAMANSALCISTTCPPMPEFFAGSALYHEAGDATTLAQHIDAVAAMAPETIHAMRHAAFERASGFTWGKTVNETVVQLQTALRER
ncbi:MAG: glycosyltransferase [Gemmatimonadaceae bacterium]